MCHEIQYQNSDGANCNHWNWVNHQNIASVNSSCAQLPSSPTPPPPPPIPPWFPGISNFFLAWYQIPGGGDSSVVKSPGVGTKKEGKCVPRACQKLGNSPGSWQMHGPRAEQKLQMPHPRDWKGRQMPRSSRGVGGGGAGIDWCITARKVWRRCKWHRKYCRNEQGWKNLKKNATDCNCGFWKLVHLTVFQSSFLFVVTIDMMFGRQILFDTKQWFCHSQVFFQVS